MTANTRLEPDWPNSEVALASLAFGLARNHPFVDGNKRTAAAVSEALPPAQRLRPGRQRCGGGGGVRGAGGGELEEAELVAWFGERVRKG